MPEGKPCDSILEGIMDVGDRVEVAKRVEAYGLRPGQQGEIVAVCDGYCLWVKFDRFNPSKQPSTKFGFPMYFEELLAVKD
jgi:hypothetical protein